MLGENGRMPEYVMAFHGATLGTGNTWSFALRISAEQVLVQVLNDGVPVKFAPPPACIQHFRRVNSTTSQETVVIFVPGHVFFAALRARPIRFSIPSRSPNETPCSACAAFFRPFQKFLLALSRGAGTAYHPRRYAC